MLTFEGVEIIAKSIKRLCVEINKQSGKDES